MRKRKMLIGVLTAAMLLGNVSPAMVQGAEAADVTEVLAETETEELATESAGTEVDETTETAVTETEENQPSEIAVTETNEGRLTEESATEAVPTETEEAATEIEVTETEEEETTIVGYLPFVKSGDTLRVEGKFVEHKDYGRQFKVETFEKLMPETLGALEKYLANGIIKGIISFGSISILINFAIRYVTIIFLFIISPFAFICLSNELTIGIFRTWFKTLFVSLMTQIIVKFIIFIPLLYKDINSMTYKIILVGIIYIIYKINGFTKEIFMKISSNNQINNIFNS